MQGTMAPAPAHHERSWFWPIVLIGVGVIWLLRNAEILTNSNIAVLFWLWPVWLILIGINLIVASRAPALSTWLAIGTVVIILAAMLVGPALGWGKVELKHITYAEPVGEATAATIDLSLGVGEIEVNALEDSGTLIKADLDYTGEVNFNVTGTTSKVVSLTHSTQTTTFGWNAWLSTNDMHWKIGLSPKVRLNLTLHGGVGNSTIDLSGLRLDTLTCNVGVGDTVTTLPKSETRYSASLNGGVGNSTINLPESTSIDLHVKAGVGDSTIKIPSNAALRLEAKGGLGGVNVPGRFTRLSGAGERFNDNNGVWETANYATATNKILITYDGGVGALRIE